MSFYNMLFGKNPSTELILALIGLKECDIERFRNCSIDREKGEIEIYTRTGGGNREDYPNEALTKNTYYKRDKDDSFDSTYASYYFKIPEEIKNDIDGLFSPEDKGISGNLIRWINQTLKREKTKNDEYTEQYQKQINLVRELQRSFHVSEAFNGHTVVPLSNYGMQRVLAAMEENEGEFIAYWNFLPYKLNVRQNQPRWVNLDNNKSEIEKDYVRVALGIVWEIDVEVWDRYKEKFKDKYPKSIGKLTESIESRIY